MPTPNLNPGQGNLSSEQILQRSFDETKDQIRTDASFSGSISGEIDCEIDATDGDNIALANEDGTKVTTTTSGAKEGLDVNVLNQLETQPTGLSMSIKNTVMTATATAQKVPATALSDRNTMSVRVMGASTVYFGGLGVTALTGYPKFQYEEIIVDIKDNPSVDLYVICELGNTCELRIIEIA